MRAIPFLELPVQLFVAGSATGMLYATVNYHRTGETERWPLFVAYFGLAGFGVGALLSIFQGLT